MTRGLLVVALLAVVAGGCAGPEQRADGVVVAVDGGIGGVSGFEIVTGTGQRLAFVPGPGVVTFDHGGPLSHLFEHLQTAAPVRVTYRGEDGVLIALIVSDAP